MLQRLACVSLGIICYLGAKTFSAFPLCISPKMMRKTARGWGCWGAVETEALSGRNLTSSGCGVIPAQTST